MKAWICAVVISLGGAAPAFAQKTDLPDRPAKRLSDYDVAAMREANTLLKLNGTCTAQFIVTAAGELSDMAIDCTHPEMAPYIATTMQTAEWQSEITGGEFFDSYPMRERFNYGTGAAAADARGEKPPVMETGLQPRDITKAIAEVNEEGGCEVKYTVGADGKPKDIQPNCTPAAYNDKIIEAVGKMEFAPGEKGGQPTEWPGMAMPLKLTKPKGS